MLTRNRKRTAGVIVAVLGLTVAFVAAVRLSVRPQESPFPNRQTEVAGARDATPNASPILLPSATLVIPPTSTPTATPAASTRTIRVESGMPVTGTGVEGIPGGSAPLVLGQGPSGEWMAERVHIMIPADSSAERFGAGNVSRCRFRGDFDVQVPFRLLLWPPWSGVKVALRSGDSDTVERVGFGDPGRDFPGEPREAYLVHFADGVQGTTTASDLGGVLRLVRSGSQLTGYYWGGDTWQELGSSSAQSTGDTPVSIFAWSEASIFGGQDVRVAFDPVQVNRGELICPG